MINEAAGVETCRFCGTEEGFRVFIFDKGSDHIKKIKCILPIKVSEADGLPKFMCYRCTYKLKETFAFQQQCLKTDTMLRSKLGLPCEQQRSNSFLASANLDAVMETSSPLLNRPSTSKLPGRMSPSKNRSSGMVSKRPYQKRKSSKVHDGGGKNGAAGVVNGKAGHRGAQPSPRTTKVPAQSSAGSGAAAGCSTGGGDSGGGQTQPPEMPSTIVVTRIPGSCSIYTCQVCERCFVSECAARDHGCVTGEEEEEEPPRGAEAEEAGQAGAETREYFCEQCSKRFTRYVSLLAHQEAHLRCFAEEELEEFEKYQEEMFPSSQVAAPIPPPPPLLLLEDTSLGTVVENPQPTLSEQEAPLQLPLLPPLELPPLELPPLQMPPLQLPPLQLPQPPPPTV